MLSLALEELNGHLPAPRILLCDMPLTTFASLILGLGFLNGLRTLIPVAAICWGVRLHWFSLEQTPFAFLKNPISLGVFSALAIGELVGDKLPKTPPRTDTFPLLARMAFAAGCAAALTFAVAKRDETLSPSATSVASIATIAAVGALAGTFAGFLARRSLTKQVGLPDLPVALVEDALAIGGSLLIVSHL